MLIYYAGADSVGKWAWRMWRRQCRQLPLNLLLSNEMVRRGKQKWVMNKIMKERRDR